jgi:hypothetical protein
MQLGSDQAGSEVCTLAAYHYFSNDVVKAISACPCPHVSISLSIFDHYQHTYLFISLRLSYSLSICLVPIRVYLWLHVFSRLFVFAQTIFVYPSN